MTCATCGAPLPDGARYCPACGAPAPVHAPAPEGDRRRVTVLFADLVGFSALAEHIDPEDLRTLMTGVFGELADAAEARGGTVEKFVGDAVMAVFGAPVAHEDDPLRAVDAALAMHEVVSRRSASSPAPLRLRIGVNSGLVVAGAVGDGSRTGVIGDAVNVAARLQAAAAPGEVVIGAATWRRVRDDFATTPLGALDVRGREDPVEAHRVDGRRAAAGERRRAPFVGRQDEIGLLELLWSRARRGQTHVVTVVGEPGVGKSRLLGELPRREDGLDVRVASQDGRAAGPVGALVATLLGGPSPDRATALARAAAAGLDDTAAATLALLQGFPEGTSPSTALGDADGDRALSAVWQLLEAVCATGPVLLLVDDLHWADPSSRALLQRLVERVSRLPVLIVLATRPGRDAGIADRARASHTQIRLEPLSADETLALVRGVLGVGTLPPDLEALLTRRAGGNPFFVQEIIRSLTEAGALTVADGRAALSGPRADVPETVQAAIVARVDRLDPRAREVLHAAAVIGRADGVDMLAAVTGADPAPQLAALLNAELVTLPSPDRWAFRHALVQETVYESLLLSRRREIHRAVADALEARDPDDPASLAALSEHADRAGDTERARRHALAAADRAASCLGFAEARRHYEAAVCLWGDGDEGGRLELLTRLGRASYLSGDGPGAVSALTEVEEGWTRLGEPRRAGAALALRGRVTWSLEGDTAGALELLGRAVDGLRPLGPSPELCEAYVWAATVMMLAGRDAEAVDLAHAGLELAERYDRTDARAHLLSTLGSVAVVEDPRGPEPLVREALRLAEESGDTDAIGRAHVNLSHVLLAAGRPDESQAVAAMGREAMLARGAPAYGWFLAGNEAWALLEAGRITDAEALARRAFAEGRPFIGPPAAASLLSAVAVALTYQGRLGEARRAVDEMLAWDDETASTTRQVEAIVEEARGNVGPARRAVRAALEQSVHKHDLATLLPLVARLLPAEEARAAIARLPAGLTSRRSQASILFARAIVDDDRERFLEAADAFHALGLPYDEAEARAAASQVEEAAAILRRLGLEAGPLGRRLGL